ncbi:unnamed protein product [Gongylonema pulchrum]|uniref:Uncharacterized protein n=1 Tax=Gongylonema pulchrum TaxID=637853 RepID=A0A3P6P9Q3_9BILA|nr:unnamed protein product [Gongylonema pulchrum]
MESRVQQINFFKEYKKHLDPSDPDYKDTEAALELVLDAATHANEMMRKLDRYKNVLEVQEQLGNAVALVSPGRELIKRGKLMKVCCDTLLSFTYNLQELFAQPDMYAP